LRVVQVDADGKQSFVKSDGTPEDMTALDPAAIQLSLVEMNVTVYGANGRMDNYPQLAAGSGQYRYIGKVLEKDDPEDENALVWLDWSFDDTDAFAPARLMVGLQAADKRLGSAKDSEEPSPDDLQGMEADVDDPDVKATGLEALGELDDIAIVALPDGEIGRAHV
jgi:hypothetical protein